MSERPWPGGAQGQAGGRTWTGVERGTLLLKVLTWVRRSAAATVPGCSGRTSVSRGQAACPGVRCFSARRPRQVLGGGLAP